jgi:hypothetical protein
LGWHELDGIVNKVPAKERDAAIRAADPTYKPPRSSTSESHTDTGAKGGNR